MEVDLRSKVALVRFTTPHHFVTLSTPLQDELCHVLKKLDRSKKTSAIVLTGQPTAFAAGADIKEMKDLSFAQAFT